MDILLFNPHAGMLSKAGLTPDDLVARLSAKGIDAYAAQDMSPEEMVEAARTSGRIIVAGGDGTVQSVLQATASCGGLRLGIIPGGTANHLASSLSIPADIDAAIDILAAGYAKWIDLGRANGSVFSQAAGAGLHAKAFHMYGERREKSKLDAASTAAKIFANWQPQLMKVVIDGEPYVEQLTQVTAANTPDYGGVFTIAPEAKVDDGLLDVLMIGSLTKLEIIEYGIAAIDGTITGMPKAYSTRAKRVEIESVLEEPIEVHADAQPVGFTPVTIDVLPGCVEVVVPEGAI